MSVNPSKKKLTCKSFVQSSAAYYNYVTWSIFNKLKNFANLDQTCHTLAGVKLTLLNYLAN